jgi:hypothetical protein
MPSPRPSTSSQIPTWKMRKRTVFWMSSGDSGGHPLDILSQGSGKGDSMYQVHKTRYHSREIYEEAGGIKQSPSHIKYTASKLLPIARVPSESLFFFSCSSSSSCTKHFTTVQTLKVL